MVLSPLPPLGHPLLQSKLQLTLVGPVQINFPQIIPGDLLQCRHRGSRAHLSPTNNAVVTVLL